MARFQRLQELGIPTIGGVDTTEPVIEMMEEIRGTAPEMEAITEKVKELPIDVDKYRTAAEAALVRQKELTKELAATFGAFVIDSTIEGADRLGRELGNALFTARKGVDVLKAAFQDLVRTIVGDLLAVGARGVTGGLIGGITRIFGGGGGGGFDWTDFWNDQQFRGGGNVTNLNFSINASSRAAGFEAGRGILQALNEAGYVR